MSRLRTGAVWCAAVASCGVGAEGGRMTAASQTPAARPIAHSMTHLRVDDTVGDLLAHPAFTGFGRLLLPWDDRRVDRTMRLREIGALLPYHTHVDPAVVVASLKRRVAALRRAGTDVEYNRYPGVGHGFGLGTGTSAEGWLADAVRFWARHIDQPGRSQEGRCKEANVRPRGRSG